MLKIWNDTGSFYLHLIIFPISRQQWWIPSPVVQDIRTVSDRSDPSQCPSDLCPPGHTAGREGRSGHPARLLCQQGRVDPEAGPRGQSGGGHQEDDPGQGKVQDDWYCHWSLFPQDPLVENFCLQCDSPVTAMTLDKDKILCGLINAKVKCVTKMSHRNNFELDCWDIQF